MKILLINSCIRLKHSVHGMYIPLGIGYIASVLRQAHHEVSLLDGNTIGMENLKKELRAVDFDLVGINVLTDGFHFIEQIIPLIKEMNSATPVILGGPMITVASEIIMKNTLADIAILGEGERTIIEVVNALSTKNDLGKIKGICYKIGSNLIFTSPQNRIKNLDEIPFPAFDLFNLKACFESKPRFPYLIQMYPYLSIMTHRGCSYHCKFCQVPCTWPQISFRSINNIIAEMAWQKKEFTVKGVYIRDDNFGPSERRIKLLCQNLVRTELNLDFVCLMRATTVNHLSANTLQLMKVAGCRGIRIGIESGTEEILRQTAKGVTLKDVERATKIIRDSGFSADGGYLMIGHPEETERSLEGTIEFVSKLGTAVLALFAIPLPGTSWYKQARKKGLITDEVEFLRELQFWEERPIVNMSQISSEKLIEAMKILKSWANQKQE